MASAIATLNPTRYSSRLRPTWCPSLRSTASSAEGRPSDSKGREVDSPGPPDCPQWWEEPLVQLECSLVSRSLFRRPVTGSLLAFWYLRMAFRVERSNLPVGVPL